MIRNFLEGERRADIATYEWMSVVFGWPKSPPSKGLRRR